MWCCVIYKPGLLQDNVTVPAGLDSLIPIPTGSVPVSRGAVVHGNGNRQPTVARAPLGNRPLALFANDLAATRPFPHAGPAQRSAAHGVLFPRRERPGRGGAGRGGRCIVATTVGAAATARPTDRQTEGWAPSHTGVGTQGVVPDALNPFKTPPSAIMAYPSVRSSLFIAPDPPAPIYSPGPTRAYI